MEPNEINENDIPEEKNLDKRMIDDYFEYQKSYTKIYGNKTIVFMQNGKFYESYNTDTEGYDLLKIHEILQVRFARKGKNTKKNDPRSKPNMLGFPTINLCNSLNLLTQQGYTVVIFDEEHNSKNVGKKTKFDRYVAGIFSVGTHISNKQDDSNYLIAIYIVSEPQLKMQQNLLAIGVTLLDISTGESIIYECYGEKYDENFGMDELLRIIQGYKPTEAIIYFKPSSQEKASIEIENIKSYLELDRIRHYIYTYTGKKEIDEKNDPMKLLNSDMFKINYQNDYLSTIFNLGNQVNLNKKTSPVELLSLENKPYVLISLLIMLNYVTVHNKNLLKNLLCPVFYSYNKHLILGNNAIQQLNVIDSNNLESYNKKIESLFDVVNKTATPMGKRLLKQQLTNPLSGEEKKIIKKKYDIIENLMKDKLFTKIHLELKNIYDLEKCHRQMARGKLIPYDLCRMDFFYKSVMKLIKIIRKNPVVFSIISENTIEKFIAFRGEYTDIFNLEIMQKYSNFDDITESIFNKKYNKKIDNLNDKIIYGKTVLETIKNILSDILPDCKTEKIQLKSDGKNYYFTVTKTHEKILKTYFKQMKKKYLNIDLDVDNSIKINLSDIEFKSTKSRTKIIISNMDDHFSELDILFIKLRKLIKSTFIKSTMELFEKYFIMLNSISKFIAELDFLVSGAMVADEYYYCKPVIKGIDNNSYIQAKKLRHPIIERLCKETAYVPNDIELGNVPIEENVNDNPKGKCLDPNTKIIMFDGSIKKAKNIKKGDLLMGDDSTARTVLGTCKGQDIMYEIQPKKGDSYTVNGAHILCLKSSGYKSIRWNGDKEQRYRAIWMENHENKSKSFSISKYGTKKKAYKEAKAFLKTVESDKGKILKISVDDYLKKPKQWRINYYTYHVGVKFPKQDVTIDPYILGHWLGDGTSSNTNFTSADEEIVDYYKKYFDGTDIVVNYTKNYHYSVGTNTKFGGKERNWYLNCLKEYDLINNKHIPDVYLHNSRKVRMAVLAGLIDSDGSNSKDTGIEIIQKNGFLADGIVYLARSLGYWCQKVECQKTCTNGKNGPVTGTYFRMYICGNDFSELPLLLEYKRPHAENKTARFDPLISSFSVIKLGEGKYCGFELDANHKFLLGDFTVTHNSKLDTEENRNDRNSQSKSNEMNGMILFGANSCGKSSLMKSIGLAVILAQIGYYVPATEFIYQPYSAIFARITGNDNLFKGLSSFVVEMTELYSILRRAITNGPNTLIIGDEICRGTVEEDAQSIVAGALVRLSEVNASFIFSSHLHSLPKLPEIIALKNLRLYHLLVEYDKENDCLIFDRRLVHGSGPDSYGLIVAKYIVKDPRFINIAETVKQRLSGELSDLPIKKSNFNKSLLAKQCAICLYKPLHLHHKQLETHHIKFQSKCLADGKIIDQKHLNKNELYNLVILCRQCHEHVHKKYITINGYFDTSIGPLLDYKINAQNKMILDDLDLFDFAVGK